MNTNSPLRQVRLERGLTLAEAAEKIGYDAGNLSRIETGKQIASRSIAKELADLYGISVLEILYPDQTTRSKRHQRALTKHSRSEPVGKKRA